MIKLIMKRGCIACNYIKSELDKLGVKYTIELSTQRPVPTLEYWERNQLVLVLSPPMSKAELIEFLKETDFGE